MKKKFGLSAYKNHRPSLEPQLMSAKEIQHLFSELLSSLLNPGREFNLDILQKCLALILWKIETGNNNITLSTLPDDDFTVFLKFNLDINFDFKSTRKVDDYSLKLGVTTRKLSTICIKFSEKTAKALINERIIAESKQKLLILNLPLKSIAEQLGFFDQYQFSTFFKKHTKISPSAFRRELTTEKICPETRVKIKYSQS